MSAAWLNIVGIGEDGLAGLSAAARSALQEADVLIGGSRHHSLVEDVRAERLTWPSPFDAMIERIENLRGKLVCVLVTGDPAWYSAGTRVAAHFKPEEVCIHSHVSAFQLAAARLGWALQDVVTLTVHGRPVRAIIPEFTPGAKMIILTQDANTPTQITELLVQHGFASSRITALSHMGGPDETRLDGTAARWSGRPADFHTLCIECIADPDACPLSRGPGLPDDAFEHDGKMTKSEVRAVTLSRLAPGPGELLWDIGCGCGSVAIEWMRMAHGAKAIGLEPHGERRAMAQRNSVKLGVPGLQLVDAMAPDGLAGLEAPDAVFIGGGLSEETVATCLQVLKPHGRLVANAVTLESEQVLATCHERHGGSLTRLSVARAEPVGSFHGWRPFMAVTQWSMSR